MINFSQTAAYLLLARLIYIYIYIYTGYIILIYMRMYVDFMKLPNDLLIS